MLYLNDCFFTKIMIYIVGIDIFLYRYHTLKLYGYNFIVYDTTSLYMAYGRYNQHGAVSVTYVCVFGPVTVIIPSFIHNMAIVVHIIMYMYTDHLVSKIYLKKYSNGIGL